MATPNVLLYFFWFNVISMFALIYFVKSDESEPLTGMRRLMKCVDNACNNNNRPSSSTVYINGVVYTVDKSTNWEDQPAEAFVIEDGTVAFVGTSEDAKAYIVHGLSNVFDLHGRVVLPGFHDIHMHPLEARSPLAGACQLPPQTRPDSKAFTDELSSCPQYRTCTEWVLGAGHSITQMLEYVHENEANSPKALLDRFIDDRPAAMLEETSHSAWVNTMALQYAGINRSTAERPGGVIMREPGSDEPNGILFENEAISIFDTAMDPTDNIDIYDYNYEGLIDALGGLAEYGITSLCDARVLWRIGHDIAWEKACSTSKLSVRAVLGLWAYPEETDDYQIQKLKELYTNGSDRCSLSKSQIKIYMDGIVESTTAAMGSAYRVNLSLPIISEENIGLNYFNKSRLETYLRELQDFGDGHGFDFHIHAIGDRGIREALDAIQAAKSSLTSRTPRHRLTHLEIIHPTDINRFHELGVIADFQVSGEFTLPSEHETLAEFVGQDAAQFSIPVRSVVDTGAMATFSSDWDVSTVNPFGSLPSECETLAEFVGLGAAQFSIPVRSVVDTGAMATFSSDWDVSTVNPFVGLQHATQRGQQSVSVKTAIEMYTANPAFAMRQEDRVGMLKEGMEADIIILDQDVLNIDTQMIHATRVLETVIKGESVYKRRNSGIEDRTIELARDKSPSASGKIEVSFFICVVSVYIAIAFLV